MEEWITPGHTKGGDPPYIFAKLPLAPRTSSHCYTPNVEESKSSRPYPITGAAAREVEERAPWR
jgi:hypothetical protein